MATTIGKEPVNVDLQINNTNPWTDADFEKLRAIRLAKKTQKASSVKQRAVSVRVSTKKVSTKRIR